MFTFCWDEYKHLKLNIWVLNNLKCVWNCFSWPVQLNFPQKSLQQLWVYFFDWTVLWSKNALLVKPLVFFAFLSPVRKRQTCWVPLLIWLLFPFLLVNVAIHVWRWFSVTWNKEACHFLRVTTWWLLIITSWLASCLLLFWILSLPNSYLSSISFFFSFLICVMLQLVFILCSFLSYSG